MPSLFSGLTVNAAMVGLALAGVGIASFGAGIADYAINQSFNGRDIDPVKMLTNGGITMVQGILSFGIGYKMGLDGGFLSIANKSFGLVNSTKVLGFGKGITQYVSQNYGRWMVKYILGSILGWGKKAIGG